ncbi:hypothetical protein Z950_1715 [Sulfitobacter mediterraneus KCTC 32188]|nr:hypothetical protein Z950_1715 [Sulfitobacter mediterraneus KCTC 32188]
MFPCPGRGVFVWPLVSDCFTSSNIVLGLFTKCRINAVNRIMLI